MKIRVITMSMGNTSDGFSNQDELDAARFAFVITYGQGPEENGGSAANNPDAAADADAQKTVQEALL